MVENYGYLKKVEKLSKDKILQNSFSFPSSQFELKPQSIELQRIYFLYTSKFLTQILYKVTENFVHYQSNSSGGTKKEKRSFEQNFSPNQQKTELKNNNHFLRVLFSFLNVKKRDTIIK